MSSRPTVSVSSTRAKIAHASDPALQRLSRMPVAAPVVALLVVVVVGAILGGVIGGFLVLLAAAVVGWIAYLAWPRLSSPERLMRASVIFLLLAVALVGGLSHSMLV